MLRNVPSASSSPGRPGTVTLPGLSGCLNCLYDPLVATRYQPSSASRRSTSRTFGCTFRRIHGVCSTILESFFRIRQATDRRRPQNAPILGIYRKHHRSQVLHCYVGMESRALEIARARSAFSDGRRTPTRTFRPFASHRRKSSRAQRWCADDESPLKLRRGRCAGGSARSGKLAAGARCEVRA